jgi:hypothetical protein
VFLIEQGGNQSQTKGAATSILTPFQFLATHGSVPFPDRKDSHAKTSHPRVNDFLPCLLRRYLYKHRPRLFSPEQGKSGATATRRADQGQQAIHDLPLAGMPEL